MLQVTTTDQATAEVSKEREPLVTLKTFRSSEALDWGMGSVGVFFGWNLVPDTQGLIKVGDTINCLQRRTTRVTLPGKQPKPAASKPDVAVGDDTIGALKSALTGAAVAALVAALVASFFYYLMKAVAANDVGLTEHPT